MTKEQGEALLTYIDAAIKAPPLQPPATEVDTAAAAAAYYECSVKTRDEARAAFLALLP